MPEVLNANLLHHWITLADAFVAHADCVLVIRNQCRLEDRRIFAPVEG